MSDVEKAVQPHSMSPTSDDDDHEVRSSRPIPNANANANNTTQQVDSTSISISISTPELTTSALEENITTKGRNSYYYTHAHKAKGPKWDGKQEPKLLSKEELRALSLDDPTATNTNNTPSSGKKIPSLMYHNRSTITSYAFRNEEKVVKLYITLDGISSEQCITDDDITLDWNDSSLTLVIKNYEKKETVSDNDEEEEEEEKAMTATTSKVVVAPTQEGKDRSLSFSRLTGTITHAKYKLKTNKIILTLTKEKEGIEWQTINDKGNNIRRS